MADPELMLSSYVEDARRSKLFSQFRPGRALLALSQEHPLTGVEREINDELRRSHEPALGNSCWVPWECAPRFNRADEVSPASTGGYLVASDLHPAISALYRNSVVFQLGASAEPAVGNWVAPTQPGVATAYWLGSETAQLNSGNSSPQTFSQTAGTPHGVGGYTEISRQLALQAAPSSAPDVVARDLFKITALAVDLAAMTGSGGNGQPAGILNLAAVPTFNGATFELSNAMQAVTDIGDALDDSAGWAANRAAAISLRQRLEFTNAGSRAIWEDNPLSGQLAGLPARSTSALPSGVLIFGAWRHLHVPVWFGGLELAVNPYANFQAGIIGCRVLAYVDSVVAYPGAFATTSTFS